MSIVFVGGGNMATALIGGMIGAGTRAGEFDVVEPHAEQRAKLHSRFEGIRVHEPPTSEVLAGADLVVLAVKPQQMREACEALAPSMAKVPALLSVAAGTRIADISRWLGGYDRIVRAMPNTPALVAAGISGVFAAPSVDEIAKERAASVVRAAGEIVWCAKESMLDAITGISASGPAYVFYFLEALERAACELDMSAGDARKLAYATFEGSMKLARASDVDPATLRAQVTSKGGTTERGIATLDEAGVSDAFVRAVKAAAERARELGDEFGKDSQNKNQA